MSGINAHQSARSGSVDWLTPPETFRGDPLHRPNLMSEAFDAGYEAGRAAALQVLIEDIASGNYRPSAEPLGLTLGKKGDEK